LRQRAVIDHLAAIGWWDKCGSMGWTFVTGGHTLVEGVSPSTGGNSDLLGVIVPWPISEGAARSVVETGRRDEGRGIDPAGLHLKEVDADQWQELRAVRLKALEQAPDAFMAVLDEEQSWQETEWRQTIKDATWVAARSAGAIIGVARSTVDSVPTRRHIEAVWVEPSWRRRGVASDLVRWLIEKERKAEVVQEILIWVIDSNKAARRLYEGLGFEPTGERPQSIQGRGSRVEERLRLHIASG
jgi:ribosomal protein S18 acetylase RimI-like enzyme